MFAFSASKRAAIIGLLMGLALVSAAFYWSTSRLSAARQSRRNDSYALAECLLAKCWHWTGLSSAIALEEELLAVQQGDLRNEQSLKSRAVARSVEGYLILEALAKGNLALFRWPEAQLYSETILKRQSADGL